MNPALAIHLLLTISLALAAPANATIREVAPGTGCSDEIGTPFCTLAAAIEKAESGDTLQLAPGLYTGPVTIEKTLAIKGARLGGSVIDGQQKGSVITIAPATMVTLDHLVIQNGVAEQGAGILNRGNLSVVACKILRNTATQSGGGIYSGGTFSSQLSVWGSEITDNVAQGDDGYNVKYGGGGIYNDGPLTVLATIIEKNQASENGGGIYTVFSGRNAASKAETAAEKIGLTTIPGPGTTLARIFDENSVLIDRSSIIDNSADTGGGINVHGVARIDNSLIARNRAIDNKLSAGGGVFAHFDTRLRITNSIISKNQAAYGGAGLRFYSTSLGKLINVSVVGNQNNTIGRGAGIFVVHDTARLELSHTLLADNLSANQAADCGGKPISLGYNLVANATGCDWQAHEGDLVGSSKKPIAAKLTWNQANVPPLFTPDVPLPSRNSPTINSGNPAGCLGMDNLPLTIDYMGLQRAIGKPHGRCDIGAIEWRPTPTAQPRKQYPAPKHAPKTQKTQ